MNRREIGDAVGVLRVYIKGNERLRRQCFGELTRQVEFAEGLFDAALPHHHGAHENYVFWRCDSLSRSVAQFLVGV